MEARRRLDPEGYIVPEADLANVQPAYRGVPEAAADLLVRELGPRLHSGYLYGSVVRGNAVPGRSDLDLVAVLWTPAEAADRLAAARVEQALVGRFPLLASAGVAFTDLREAMSPRQRYGFQVFLRDLCVCVCGEDLRPGLPRTRPSAAVAAAFHEDTPLVLARARETLRTRPDPEAVRRACRIATRRMVQAGFAVAMARGGVWATVLEEQAAAVGAAFPRSGPRPRGRPPSRDDGRSPTRTPWSSCWIPSGAGWRRPSGGCHRLRDQFESVARPLGCAAVPAA